MKLEDNLLIKLNKYAKRSGENFTTEAFAHLLRHLQEYEPKIVCKLLKAMSYEELNLTALDVEHLKINTQVTHSEGRPDIEIIASNYLIFIEVKVSAGLGKDQLRRYQKTLAASNIPNKKLIFLSRLPSTTPDRQHADISIRWYQIGEWLEDSLNNETIIHESSKYVIKQFIEFLQGNNLVIKPVKRNIIDEFQKMLSLQISRKQEEIEKLEELLDYPTLYNLLMMMDKVMDIQPRPILTQGKLQDDSEWNSEWIGYNIQGGEYFFYVCCDRRECRLRFTTWNCYINLEQSKEEFGQIVRGAGRLRWQRDLNLTRPSVQFFSQSKSKEDQIQIIEKFYRDSYESAQKITQK